jgi:serine/threonine protein kinase
VHADLKPENIIIDFDEVNEVIISLKIIDMGSSFMLTPEGITIEKQQHFASSTPEYLPPEIHSYLSKRFT